MWTNATSGRHVARTRVTMVMATIRAAASPVFVCPTTDALALV